MANYPDDADGGVLAEIEKLGIDMSQPLARLAFYLIEPRSDDGLADWNLVDGLEADAKTYPIVRSVK